MFRSKQRFPARFHPQPSNNRTVLRVRPLEDRVVPTTDIIMDFNGGTLQSGHGYLLQQNLSNNGDNTYLPFAGFKSTNPPSAAVRTQQIEQIVAGVREDYADFNVRVIWDDRGVDSPFYDGDDTVLMIVGDSNPALFGIASSVDLSQSNRDTALVFGPTHEGLFPDTTYRSIREIIDTCSHEAGHTLGLSHTSEADAEGRQIVTIAPQNTDLDSRFSSQPLDHAGPETGVVYVERDRLFQNVGTAPAGTTLSSQEAFTGETLPAEAHNTFVPGPATLVTLNGQIDFGGDRDAFQITVGASGTYQVRERAAVTGAGIAPVIFIYNQNGDIVAQGDVGSAGGTSIVTFVGSAGQTFYIVTGTTMDVQPSGTVGIPTIGGYVVDISQNLPPILPPPPPPPPPLQGIFAAASDVGGAPIVRVFDLATGAIRGSFFAFDPLFSGGVRIAMADFNGDGIQDIVTAAGPGGGPHVRVFNGRNLHQLLSPIGSFLAYGSSFTGGVYVATGDVNGDGVPDIITGAGQGGGPHVRVFSGVTGQVIREFMAYGVSFTGGVSVAAGDINADGFADVVTGAGPGGGPHVEAFDVHNHTLLSSFMAYGFGFRGGVFVSSGDVNGDGHADIVTGAGAAAALMFASSMGSAERISAASSPFRTRSAPISSSETPRSTAECAYWLRMSLATVELKS